MATEAQQPGKTREWAIAECIENGTHERAEERDPQCGTCPGEVFPLTPAACQRGGKHVVYPTEAQWPVSEEARSLGLRCDSCGVWCVFEHAKKTPAGWRVVEPRKAA